MIFDPDIAGLYDDDIPLSDPRVVTNRIVTRNPVINAIVDISDIRHLNPSSTGSQFNDISEASSSTSRTISQNIGNSRNRMPQDSNRAIQQAIENFTDIPRSEETPINSRVERIRKRSRTEIDFSDAFISQLSQSSDVIRSAIDAASRMQSEIGTLRSSYTKEHEENQRLHINLLDAQGEVARFKEELSILNTRQQNMLTTLQSDLENEANSSTNAENRQRYRDMFTRAVQGFTKKIKTYRPTIQRLEERLKNGADELAIIQTQFSELITENESLKTVKNAAEELISSQVNSLSEARNQINSIMNDLNLSNEALQEANQSIGDNDIDIRTLSATIRELTAALLQQRAITTNKFDKLDSEFKTLDIHYKDLQHSYFELNQLSLARLKTIEEMSKEQTGRLSSLGSMLKDDLHHIGNSIYDSHFYKVASKFLGSLLNIPKSANGYTWSMIRDAIDKLTPEKRHELLTSSYYEAKLNKFMENIKGITSDQINTWSKTAIVVAGATASIAGVTGAIIAGVEATKNQGIQAVKESQKHLEALKALHKA